jgi:hypothetical protein
VAMGRIADVQKVFTSLRHKSMYFIGGFKLEVQPLVDETVTI